MILKRLIAISVVFALVAGTAFAADVSGGVIGTVNFLEGSSAKDANDNTYPIGASAGFQRLRLEGSGENDDGTFGAWLRVEGFTAGAITQGDVTGHSWEGEVMNLFKGYGHAWWKPIDMFKLGIGGNPDGFYGKEGVTGWMFYQTASDTGVVNPGNVWGGSYLRGDSLVFRNAFYGGFGDNALHLTISPTEMVDINIAVPFWSGIPYDVDDNPEGSAASIFKRTVAQVDLKLDFGNIALTYTGDENKYTFGTKPSPGTIFAYFGLTSIENLGVDVGIGFPLPLTDKDSIPDHKATIVTPIAAGFGVKFDTGSFGIKVRLVASFAGSSKVDYDGDAGKADPVPFTLLADILPFFAVNDTLRIFFSAGLGIIGEDKNSNGDTTADSVMGFHIDPYVEVGSEWGPKFLAGFRLDNSGGKPNKDADAVVNWSVPLALHIGF